jgi:hypothetical protein
MKRSNFVFSCVSAFALVCAAVCARPAQAVIPPYDSVTQKVIDGIIDDGLILVKPDVSDYEPLIRQQLMYTLGQLNWNDAAPKLSWFKVEVGELESVDEETGLVPVHYKAQGHIAWSRKEEMPSEQEMILPARGDESGLKAFVKRYFHACTNDPEAERRGYFYFFYPSLKSCPMSHASDHELEREKGWVVRFPMHFEENHTNTRDKYPEYDKLWEDHKLSVTAIFGKVKPEGGAEDEGVRAYNTFYAMLVNRFGQPRVAEEGDRRALRLTWRFGNDALEVHLRLVKVLANVGQSFINWYQQRTQDSDVIIYSGHAGLGDNIDVLIKNAVFKPRKYQIFFVNGCDTFTYVNEELFSAHGAATPHAPVSKYLDIITNSVSVYFARMGDGAFSLVDELVKKKNTYHEILRRMDSRQRAIVDGEEDNTWPESFRDWQAGQSET